MENKTAKHTSFLFLPQISRSPTKPTYFMPCAPPPTMTLCCVGAGRTTGDIWAALPVLELSPRAVSLSEQHLSWLTVRSTSGRHRSCSSANTCNPNNNTSVAVCNYSPPWGRHCAADMSRSEIETLEQPSFDWKITFEEFSSRRSNTEMCYTKNHSGLFKEWCKRREISKYIEEETEEENRIFYSHIVLHRLQHLWINEPQFTQDLFFS